MSTQGFSFNDISPNQIGSVADIADKKVNQYKSPISVAFNLNLAEKSNKLETVKNLLSEFDKRNLWGKVDIVFARTTFSSSEIKQITDEIGKYKDKAVNFVFDNNANNFSQQDLLNIFNAYIGGNSNTYPFTAMSKDGLSPEMRQKFFDSHPNIIETGGANPNLKKIKDLLGLKTNDMRGEIVDACNTKKISVSEYVSSIISSMNMKQLKELQKYSGALERLSLEYNALTLGNLQQRGYDDQNVFFQTVKNTLDNRIQSIENSKVSQTTNQEQKSENKNDNNNDNNNISSLQDKYYDLISTNKGTAEELWNMANQLEQNDKDGEYTKYAPYAVVERDPTFKSQTMFNIIASNANYGYADSSNPSDEIGAYVADANALSLLAKHNPDIASSSRLLNTLNKISKETISCYDKGKTNDKEASTYFSMFALNIIPAYGKCSYDTPKQAITALDNIANITKNLDEYARNPHDIINSTYSIVNSCESDKDLAKSAFRAVNLVTPQNSEEATKLLSLYKTISLDNPDLAEASMAKIHNIFKSFPEHELIQKECLSTIEALNGFRSRFDEDTQKKIDLFTKSERNTINAQTMLRKSGQQTTWKPQTQKSDINGRDNINKTQNNNSIDPKIFKRAGMEM